MFLARHIFRKAMVLGKLTKTMARMGMIISMAVKLEDKDYSSASTFM